MATKRLKLKMLHKSLVAQNKYWQAWKVLQLLLNHRITLGLSDADMDVEELTTKLGCRKHINMRWYTCTVWDR